jgi:hypothetical protein
MLRRFDMKRLTIVCIVFLLVAGIFSGCHSHDWKDATCILPQTCEKCEETRGDALGHTTTSGTCSRCGEEFTSWKIGEFVDEFKKPTGDKYVSVDVYNGIFSNSATTNSKLYAVVQVTKEDIGIMLWEYGSNLVKGIYDYNEYSITILDQAGKKHYMSGTLYEGSTRVYIDNKYEAEMLQILQKDGEISFYLEDSKYSVSTYLFTINCDGFLSLYAQIK